ncbi:MAG: 5-formyltetrahydrofolate cyclo-ligase [Haloferacaceae archaeon]
MTADARDALRERVWADLREVARPDSRFGWDFAEFIADYEGSDRGAERLLSWAEDAGRDRWFVTPDNNLDALRERLIERGRPFLMPTYGIVRGVLRLDPADVPSGQAAFAATLDGMTRFAERVPIEDLERDAATRDVMVTGASFVTRDGLRMGKGHGFFDLEWAICRRVGLADADTAVVAAVHDAQLVDPSDAPDAIVAEHDTVVDRIVTPTRTVVVGDPPAKPEGVRWSLLDRETVDRIPPLRTLWERDGRPSLDG